MSWLYTIVIAGLLFSSGTDSTSVPKQRQADNASRQMASGDETEKLDQTYPLSPNGKVSVSNINGSITVEAWDRNEVHLEATKTADSRETLDDVQIRVDSQPDSLTIETDYKDWKWNGRDDRNRHRKLEVQYKLTVPRTAMLNELETVNGSVTVSNFTNFTKVSTVNGTVNAANLRGIANLTTVNGEVIADFDQLPQSGRINLSTVNGSVKLTIPSDSNATLKADSLNGDIDNEFGLPVSKGQYIGRNLYGKIGGGDTQIKLNSVNGPLSIGRKKDGKNPNPATNLLPSKKDNDTDWDDYDVSVNLNDEQIQEDVQRAMNDAKRNTATAMRESERALRNMKLKMPDIQVKIDEKKLEKTINESLKIREEAMERMKEAMWLRDSPRIEKKTNSFQVKGTPKVNIDADDCDVSIRGWDKPEVRYSLTEISDRNANDPSSVSDGQTGSDITIKVASGSGRRSARRLEVFVPRNSDLKVKTAGEIRMEGVSGSMDLQGLDERIDVRDSKGVLKIANTDGLVRVVDFSGDLVANTSSGDIYLDGDFERLTANAVDGSVVVTLPNDTNADLQSNESTEFYAFDSVTKQSDGKWRLGSGGRKYSITADDGSVKIQSRETLSR